MYDNPSLKTQRTVYKNVDNSNNNNQNLNYIQNQSKILQEQNQAYRGHIPDYITSTPNDNLIQQVAWNIDADSTRYNKNKMSNKRNNHNNNCDNNGNNTNVSEIFSGPNKEYNPYLDYLKKKGLLNDNYKTRITSHKINIDSRVRNIEPYVMKSNDIILDTNPLNYEIIVSQNLISNSEIYLMNISLDNSNNNYSIGDRITINNIQTEKYSLMPIYEYFNSGNDKLYGYSIIFQNGFNYLIIKTDFKTSVINNQNSSEYNINTTPDYIYNQFSSFSPNFYIGDSMTYTELKNYDTSDMYVTLSGFIGTNIGNIPTNFLNSTHRIYLTNPNNEGEKYINIPDGNGIVTKITGFYIMLPFNYTSSYNAQSPLPYNIFNNMIININFEYIGGIPINTLNCDIPITNNNIKGYYLVYSASNVSITIQINKKPYYIYATPPDKPETGQVPINFGGNGILLSKISQIYGSYPDPNNYVIELPEVIHNIFMIKLLSSQFPNTSQTFKKNINNKIYWKNLDDGDVLYVAEINNGNYNTSDLQSQLQTIMYNIIRENVPANPINYFSLTNYSDDIDIYNHIDEILLSNQTQINKGGYTNRVLFNITIDQNTNITTFKSYKEANLRRPIIKITDAYGNEPPTQQNATDPIAGKYEPPYILKILHPNHGLSIGDEILFSGFISDRGIPNTVLNTTQIITNIENKDTYQIIIDNFNLILDRTKTYGGYAAKVYVPNKFSLLFNYSDTMGNELGFRNVGSDIAIFDYATVITNKDAYKNETTSYDPPTGIYYTINSSGQQIILENKSLKLSGDDYVLLHIREFAGNINFGQNKNLTDYFAKINLSGLPGKILYDTFVSAPVVLYDMIDLKTLSILLYGSDGNLYNFNGVEHSFVLELTTLDLLPQETGINANNNFI